MKKLIALLMEKKHLRMFRKMMILTFFELYAVYIKIRKILFPYLPINKDASVSLKVIHI